MSFSVNKTDFIFNFSPYNPFNYFIKSFGLYMETGMQDWVKIGFADPYAYQPGEWHFVSQYGVVKGYLQFNETSDGQTSVDSQVLHIRNSPIESIALGCSEKTNIVEMTNPTGGLFGLVQSSTLQQNSYFFESTHDFWSFSDGPFTLAGTRNDFFGTDTDELSTRTVSTSGVPTGPFGIGGEFSEIFKATTKDFCDGSIIYKKWAQATRPSTLYPGKLRFLVQAFYGSNFRRYTIGTENGSDLLIGVNERNAALSTGFDGTVFLYTFGTLRYFLGRISSEGVDINYLEPSGEGESLRKYLIQENIIGTPGIGTDIEGYLMTTLIPTRWIRVPNSNGKTLQAYEEGSPYSFGWKPSWDGKLLSVVTSRKNERNHVFTNILWTLTTNEIGTTTENIFEQWSSGFYGAVENDYYPFNQAFYDAFLPTINFTLIEQERGDFQLGWSHLQIQNNKIWTWNEIEGKYEWNVPYDPFKYPLPSFPKNPDAPIYCWYGDNDNLIIVYYEGSDEELEYTSSVLGEAVCGPGEFFQCNVARQNVNRAGFSVKIYEQEFGIRRKNSTFNAEVDYANMGGPQYAEKWVLNAGASLCTGIPLSEQSEDCKEQIVNSGGVGYWTLFGTGEGECFNVSGNGSESTHTAIVIPQQNSEGVFISTLYDTNLTGTVTFGSCETITGAKTAWYCDFSPAGCATNQNNGRGIILDTVDPPCSKDTFNIPEDAIVYGPSFDLSAAHTDDCNFRDGQPCGIELGSVRTHQAGWSAWTYIDSESSGDPIYAGDFQATFIGNATVSTKKQSKGASAVNFTESCDGQGPTAGSEESYLRYLEDIDIWSGFNGIYDLAAPYTSSYVDYRESANYYVKYGIINGMYVDFPENPFPEEPKSFVGAI